FLWYNLNKNCEVEMNFFNFLRMDLIIQTSEITDRLFVAFKVAKKKKLFKANKAGYVNSPYQSFSASFPVELSKKPHYEDILKDLHE
ncbi:TPA: hypothetical protein ACJRUV_002275, partial [Streptococcus agalactiae]